MAARGWSAALAGNRPIGLIALGLVLGLLVAVQSVYFGLGSLPGDAFNYLAAGERLNAGHPLYALSPGDRPVDLHPPYWTVPLLSPPPIAVVFRLFALFGDAGAYLWWGLQLVALATSLVLLGRRLPPLAMAGAMLLLLLPTVYEIGMGNLNSMMLLGSILAWRWAARGQETRAGGVTAVMTAVKLTPAALAWWLLVTGRRRAVAAAVAVGAVTLLISVLGAGLDSHLEYLGLLAGGTAFAPSPLSLGGMAAYLGLPAPVARHLPTLFALGGLLGVLLARRRPAAAYRIALVTMILGSPSVSINWFVMLYALLAPTAWPLGRPSAGPGMAAGGEPRGEPGGTQPA